MNISEIKQAINDLSVSNKEAAEKLSLELSFLASAIQNKLAEIGLEHEIDVYFGNQWLCGVGDNDYGQFDKYGYDHDGNKKGSWVSSSSFSC